MAKLKAANPDLSVTVEDLTGGLTELEVLARILGESKVAPYDIVRETLKGLGVADEAAWKRFLHDGFLTDSASAAVAAEPPASTPTPAPARRSSMRL